MLTNHSDNNDIEYIYKSLDQCDLSKCTVVPRYYVSEKHEAKYSDGNIDGDFAVNQEVFDQIHCHLCHCYDIGFELTSSEQQSIELDILNNNITETLLLKHILNAKQSKLNKISNTTLKTSAKFTSNLNGNRRKKNVDRSVEEG